MNKKGQCRWCGKKLYWDYLYKHEPGCLEQRKAKVYADLSASARSYTDNQLTWSMGMAHRWRGLPGKGWELLDMVPMVELVGRSND